MYQNGGFYWWMGVVEDRNDPEALGRCRVRIAGYNSPDKDVLPTEDLPWAIPLLPMTSASISGVGHSPTGPVEGTWVLGFYLDGDDCQIPVMLGTFPGRGEALNLEVILAKLLAALFATLSVPSNILSTAAIPVVDLVKKNKDKTDKQLESEVKVLE
jgi:hypothetical protein